MTEQVPGPIPGHIHEQGHGTGRGPMVLTVLMYVVLTLLGVMAGLLGGFHHSWYIRPVPASALAWIALLFAVCHGAGRVMEGKGAALAPATGWLLATMLWLAERPEGDVIIANDVSGYVYLYGSVIAIMAGVLLVPSRGGSWLLTERSYGRGRVKPDPT
ncbi:DUF6113 family protein [Planobispora longispora]|uniref:DUF6113 family protein n=1 Tax=Planobispora longispora TaxID=28887 RepID=UPI001943CA66|nr:DUF6113 family protein [Planobispora longispora]